MKLVYNAPEFIKEPVRTSPQILADAAFSDVLTAKLDSTVVVRTSQKK
jgi:predicted lipid carrier protein YhbT